MKGIFKALAAFQQEVPVIHKNTEGYGYTYTDLPEILKVINPLMNKHGLGFTQLLNGEDLKTIIFHTESGEVLESSVHIKQDVTLAKMNDFQVMGSAITYYRRYALSAALGLVTEKDADAAGQAKLEVKDSRKWLNPNTSGWNNAIEKKASLSDVLKHYKLSKDNGKKYIEELKSK